MSLIDTKSSVGVSEKTAEPRISSPRKLAAPPLLCDNEALQLRKS
jgi:hypothetical protein